MVQTQLVVRLKIAPSRLALAATWLVAVVLATGIGLVAVNSVGDAASGRGPLGPDTLVVGSPARPTAPTTPQPGGTEVSREFRYEFGTFTVSCNGPFARVLDTAPAKGWRTDSFEPGPDDDVELVFSNTEYVVEIEVFCNRGMPDLSELDRGLRIRL